MLPIGGILAPLWARHVGAFFSCVVVIVSCSGRLTVSPRNVSQSGREMGEMIMMINNNNNSSRG